MEHVSLTFYRHLRQEKFYHESCSTKVRALYSAAVTNVPSHFAEHVCISELHIEDKDPTGTKLSIAARRRSDRLIHRTDPPCVGEFRINIEDPGFPAMFVSKSSLFHHDDD